MQKILIILSIASLALSCGSTKNTASMSKVTEQSSAEWTPLFDGKTTTGWHTYGKTTIGSAWKIQDKALYFDPTDKGNGGDIITDQEFDNFHLKLEWKVAPNANSGVIFYIHEDLAQFQYPWNTGLEMQVLDNNGHPDAKINKHRAGDLYDLVASSTEPVKPVGEWNLAEIISDNGKLEFRLNGVSTVKTTLWNDEWRQMVAGSKFATMSGFGTFKSGKIGLQDHGDPVWYRNIVIKKL